MTPRVGFETLGKVAQRCNRLQYKVEKGDLDASSVIDVLDRILAGEVVLARTVTVVKEDLPYANEKTDSTRTYPGSYKVRPAKQQVKFWKKYYPKLDDSHVERLVQALPNWGDGALICPKPTAISGLTEASGQPEFEDHWRTARTRIIDLLKKLLKNFHNWFEGKLGPEYSRPTDVTAIALERLCEETPGDFLVIPFQSGLLWRGCSVRHVRVRFEENEFGMCTFVAGCLLASHPDRITADGQLYLDCAGEERSPGGDGAFSYAPVFSWLGGELLLARDWVHDVGGSFGSGSCLAPVSAP